MAKTKGVLTTSDYLTMEDFNKLLSGLRKDKKYVWEAYCRISFCTALRVGDVLKLRWVDVLTPNLVVKEQKTGKVRTIKINSSVLIKLKELYELIGRPDMSSLVVVGGRNPEKAMSREYINRQLKFFKFDYCLSLEAFSTHTFRKTFGRYVYESNGKTSESLFLLNTIFKHATLEVTKRYIGLTQDNINNVFESIKM